MKILRLFDLKQLENGSISNAIKGMPNLEKLYLHNCGHITVDDIRKMITNAPVINELQLDCQLQPLTVDTKSFKSISQLAKRENGIKLKLGLSGVYCRFEVPQYIVERNKLWIQVDNISFHDVQPMDVIEYYDYTSGEGSDSESSDYSDSSEW